MDLLLSYWALAQSFAKSVPTVAPQCAALVMPAVQDAAFVGSLAWQVIPLLARTLSLQSGLANTGFYQDFVSYLANL